MNNANINNNLDNKFNIKEIKQFKNKNLKENGKISINQNDNSNLFNDNIIKESFSFEEMSKNAKEKLEKTKIDEKLNLCYNTNISFDNYKRIIFNIPEINNNSNYNDNLNNNVNKKIDNNQKNGRNNEAIKKSCFFRRPNDWVCSKCFNLNFAFRLYCNRCSAPKFLQ